MSRTKTTILVLLALGLGLARAQAREPAGRSLDAAEAAACGLGVNLPLVGRLIGAGPTLYTSTLDVSNNATSSAQVDFYLDGSNATSGAALSASGTISSAGELVPLGTGGSMRSRSNAHFDDFIEAAIQAGLLPSAVETDGFLGSVLFVFNGFSKSGQGSATVRFYSAYGGGTIGQALKGHEISSNEPRALIAAFRDSRGQADAPQLYANMFVSNTGLTPSGSLAAGSITVRLQAYANSSGQAIGTATNVTIGAGQTASISDVLHRLQVPSGEGTVLVTATATSGTAAIAGVAVEIDNTTKDGSVVEMSRGDF